MLYADDSILLCSDCNIQSLKNRKKIFGLLDSKTHCVLFIDSRKDLNGNFHINTQNRVILLQSAIRGAMLDHKLTWNDHTRLFVEKLYMVIESSAN